MYTIATTPTLIGRLAISQCLENDLQARIPNIKFDSILV
jgi:hypothetical protein